jgi:hypothetical protein
MMKTMFGCEAAEAGITKADRSRAKSSWRMDEGTVKA